MRHIVTITGPSLSGKTQLSKILQEEHGFNAVVSVTTRPKRKNEEEGIDYYFISQEDYKNMKFVQKTHFNNHFYGVSENEIVGKNSSPIIWVVAPESIEQIERYCNDKEFLLTKIFVTNPEEVLYARLLERFKSDTTGSVETYVKRLQSMTNVEKNWSIDAKNNPKKYDIVISEFNKENTEEKVQEVLWCINNKNDSVNNDSFNIANPLTKNKMK